MAHDDGWKRREAQKVEGKGREEVELRSTREKEAEVSFKGEMICIESMNRQTYLLQAAVFHTSESEVS